jgi:putative DNA primase/helicase
LGEKNYSGIPLQKLEENDFKEMELFNKLANIGADISDAPLKSTAKLKGLSGGDVINASVKFKNDITFQNETKLVFSANKLPKTYDLTPAFFRRWVYIVYPFRFLTASEIISMPLEKRKNLKTRTDDIIKSLVTEIELSGLLNEALKGLEHLLSTGDFTSSKTGDTTMKWWINNSDSLLGFCYEHIEEDVDSMLSKDEFRKEYQKYCHLNRVSSEGDSHIKETLTRTFHAWDYQDSGGQRYWKGLKFVDSKVVITSEKL